MGVKGMKDEELGEWSERGCRETASSRRSQRASDDLTFSVKIVAGGTILDPPSCHPLNVSAVTSIHCPRCDEVAIGRQGRK